jgi:hypothetical protein
MSMVTFLGNLSVLSGLVPVIAALFKYRNLDRLLKLAAGFFLMNVLADLLQLFTMFMGAKNNMPVIHLNIIISLFFITAIYYNALVTAGLKKLVLISGGISLLGFIYCLIFINDIWHYPSSANTILSLLSILFSVLYFVQLLNRQEFIHIERLGFFWINSGILFYFSVNIFLFMLFPSMIANHQEAYYAINTATNIITNMLFTVGLFCKPQKGS